MARGKVDLLMLIALNVLATMLLLGHFSTTEYGAKVLKKVQTTVNNVFEKNGWQTPFPTVACGLAPWDEYIVTSTRVVLPSGVHPAAVHIKHGKIVDVTPGVAIEAPIVLNFKDAVISPGVIDVHVHLNEPGRADWEGITSGTTAAAVGGITTVIDMPLNSFPTTTIASRLLDKQTLANEKAIINVGHWAGLTPENAADHTVLQGLVDAGAMGFKSFMSPSGIDDFPNVGAAHIAAALPFLKKAGVPFFVHAELVSPVPEHEGEPTQYAKYMASRPPKFEQDAIELLIRLLEEDTTPAAPGFVLHIAHLADAGALPMIKAAQGRGLPISVETCAHYLVFSSEQIGDGKTLYKCAPPIRGEDNRKALLAAVLDGSINLVSSDHSPAPPELKQTESGDFVKAWGGISGVQYLLPATWTAIKASGGDLTTLAKVLSSEPAKLIAAADRKGQIQQGYDADLVVWDPELPADTSKQGNQHLHKGSPYADKELDGRVLATVVQGHMIVYQGQVSLKPCGTPVITRHGAKQPAVDQGVVEQPAQEQAVEAEDESTKTEL